MNPGKKLKGKKEDLTIIFHRLRNKIALSTQVQISTYLICLTGVIAENFDPNHEIVSSLPRSSALASRLIGSARARFISDYLLKFRGKIN
jgi:hypothetical protein